MRGRLLSISLLCLSLLLGAGWLVSARRNAALGSRVVTPVVTTNTKSSVVIRKQYFSWQEVESTNYATYITNLRNIGCPDTTIRDIIVADVNQLYAQRLAQRMPSNNQPWWSNATTRQQLEAYRQARIQLETERQALLSQLLGTNWNGTALASVKKPADGLPLEGSVLGVMPAETKQAVRDLINQAEAQARELGLSKSNPAGVVQYERELWKKLGSVLSPQQLEEFKLRYSANAGLLRDELDGLKYFKVSPDEFRNIFRATDDLNNQLRALGDATDVATQAKRQSLLQQRAVAIKNTLGGTRYADYVQLQNPTYQQATAQAQAAGAPNNSVDTLYQINQATADEKALIANDPLLSASEKAIEAKKAEVEQLKAQAEALGQAVPADPPPALPPQPTYSPIVHPTGANESLDSLSKLYGVSVQDLINANPTLNMNGPIPKGTTVNIPKPAPPSMPQ